MRLDAAGMRALEQIVETRVREQMAGMTSFRELGVPLRCLDCGAILQRKKDRFSLCVECLPAHASIPANVRCLDRLREEDVVEVQAALPPVEKVIRMEHRSVLDWVRVRISDNRAAA